MTSKDQRPKMKCQHFALRICVIGAINAARLAYKLPLFLPFPNVYPLRHFPFPPIFTFSASCSPPLVPCSLRPVLLSFLLLCLLISPSVNWIIGGVKWANGCGVGSPLSARGGAWRQEIIDYCSRSTDGQFGKGSARFTHDRPYLLP